MRWRQKLKSWSLEKGRRMAEMIYTQCASRTVRFLLRFKTKRSAQKSPPPSSPRCVHFFLFFYFIASLLPPPPTKKIKNKKKKKTTHPQKPNSTSPFQRAQMCGQGREKKPSYTYTNIDPTTTAEITPSFTRPKRDEAGILVFF